MVVVVAVLHPKPVFSQHHDRFSCGHVCVAPSAQSNGNGGALEDDKVVCRGTPAVVADVDDASVEPVVVATISADVGGASVEPETRTAGMAAAGLLVGSVIPGEVVAGITTAGTCLGVVLVGQPRPTFSQHQTFFDLGQDSTGAARAASAA